MSKQHRGSSLLEVLVALTLFAFASLGLAKSQALSQVVRAKTLSNSRAMQTAIVLLESYTTLDPLTLSASNNFTDTVTVENATFTRSVQITVNSDISRTVLVTVTDIDSSASANVTLTLATQGSS